MEEVLRKERASEILGMSQVSSKLSALKSEMLTLRQTGIDPKDYEGLCIRLRVVMQDIARNDLSEAQQRLFENLLLGVSSLYDIGGFSGLLGEDELKILWAVELAAKNSGHKVDCERSKERAAEHMFDDIAMRFVCKRENVPQVMPRASQIRSKYIGLIKSLAIYHDLEGMRSAARKARLEVIDVLSVYDWHMPTQQPAKTA